MGIGNGRLFVWNGKSGVKNQDWLIQMIQNLDNVDIITKEKQAKSTTCTVDGAS